MIVAIPTMGDKGLDEVVSSIFGRAQFFTFVDGDNVEIKKNPGAFAQHAAGVVSAKIILNSGAKVVIAQQIGPTSYELLKEAGVEIFRGSGRIKDVLEKLEKNELDKLLPGGYGHGFGGHGGGHGFGGHGRRWA